MSKENSLKEQGNTYFKKKDYEKAIHYYREGLEINPQNWILNNNIAQAYLANKKYLEAQTHAVISVALQENSVKGYYRAAKAAYLRNRIKSALDYVRMGLSVCPQSEELRALMDQLKNQNKPPKDLTNGYPEKTEEKSSHKPKKQDNTGARSRSTSRVSSSSSSVDTNETKSSYPSDTKATKKSKGNRGPIEIEDIQNDKVLEVVESIVEEQKVSKAVLDKTTLETIRKELLSYMKDGSEAYEKGLARRASEKFKSAVDVIVVHSYVVFGLKELDYVVLRYCLSISYIEIANYNDIVKSLEYLEEIEEKHSAKLPAVYYALGNAYCKLNRFRVALDHLDKGMKVIEKGFKITTHPWPGTMNIIKETTKAGLEESLEALINYCRTYREPDATCRFEKCLDISTHIVPSEFIFYSDPDYIGYVVVTCEANCRITYHINCWKAFKESLSEYPKLSEKDILGRACLTSDCVNENNVQSVIVKIEIYGDDGNVKSSCSKEPIRLSNNIIKENKKEKKKKDKASELILQVKRIKPRKREKKTESINAHNKEEVTRITSDFSIKLKKLDTVRKMNFGFPLEEMFSPYLEYYGHSDLASLEKYLTPEYVGDTEELRNRKEFIFTYFFEYIKNEGPQKMSDIEDKWRDEASQFPGVSEFMSENDGICNFLLQSYRFAALDEFLCVASQLPIAYDLVRSVLSEGLTFTLEKKVKSLGKKCPLPEPQATVTPIEGVAPEEHSNSPPPLEPILEDDNISMPASDEPNFLVDEETSNNLDTLSDLYYSDHLDSESDSDDDTEDDEDDEEQDDDGEHSDKSESSVTSGGLNPNAEEFQPSAVQTSEVGKLFDLLQNPANSHASDHTKEQFVEYVTSYFTGQTESDALLNTAANNHIEEQKDVGLQVPVIEPKLSVEMETQTEPGRNFEQEIAKLSADMIELHKNLEAQRQFAFTLEEKHAKESVNFQETMKSYEEKILKIETERLKEIKTLQSEISKRESKIDNMKKKHAEQIDKLNKLVDDGSKVSRDREAEIQELKVIVASLNTRLEEKEQQERESLQKQLDTKKALGEYKISQYIENCTDKLKNMRNMLKYLSPDSTPSSREMLNAISEWEGVQRQAKMIRAQFQILYSLLSEQLAATGTLDASKDLALNELPPEPDYPVEDMEAILEKALERRNVSSPVGGGGDAPMHVNTSSNVRPSPLLPTPARGYMPQVQGPNLYMASPQYPFGSAYPTGAFGGAGTPFGARIPTPKPPPLMMVQTQVPFQGFVPNGPTLSEQNENFPNAPRPLLDSQNNMPRPFSDSHNKGPRPSLDPPEDGLKSHPIEPTKKVEPFKKPTVASPVPKLEPVTDPVPPKPTEKKKLSAVAGLTPIERKAPPPPAEPAKKLGAVPKTHHKPMPSDMKNTTSSSTSSAKIWKYEKLLLSLKNHFRTEDVDELSVCLAIARERNNNTLSGLTVPVIFEMVGKVLHERSETMINNGSMAMDKFGGCPWGSVKEPDFEWNKPVVEDFEECIICHVQMTTGVTPLQCKHSFHTECIRKWLKTNSTCPMCRKYTTLNDEFPPLA